MQKQARITSKGRIITAYAEVKEPPAGENTGVALLLFEDFVEDLFGEVLSVE